MKKEGKPTAQSAHLCGSPSPQQDCVENGESQDNNQSVTQLLQDLGLSQRVERALRATRYRPLRVIDAFVNDRILYLIGWVPSYYLKQIAQEIALAVPGVRQVHNVLLVESN